jgi:uncharacterized protein (DUF3084 family)
MAQRPRPTEHVSGTYFRWIIGGLVGVAIAVLGVLHSDLRTGMLSDLSDLRADIRDIRTNVLTISGRIQETREDMSKASALIENQITVSNTKLDALVEAERKRP